MSSNDEPLRTVLAQAAALGIGTRRRRYDGDVAGLLKPGRTDFALAASIAIYFDGPRDAFAEPVLSAWDEFLGRFGDRIKWYADEDLGKWRPATGKRLERPRARLANPKAMPFYAWTAVSGDRFEDASAVTFTATVRDGAGGKLSFVRATFPPDDVAAADGAARFLSLAKRWSERMPMLHGYAGLTVNQSPHEPQPNSGLLLQIAERFVGPEIDDCGGTILVARDAIKGVNWLTLLGKPFVERLGGAAALSERLSPAAIQVHRLASGGAIVQAGPAPQLGDLQRGDDLQPYREVAAALRPIRLTTHPALGPAEFGSFGREGTERWLRRFDS